MVYRSLSRRSSGGSVVRSRESSVVSGAHAAAAAAEKAPEKTLPPIEGKEKVKHTKVKSAKEIISASEELQQETPPKLPDAKKKAININVDFHTAEATGTGQPKAVISPTPGLFF